MRLRFEDKVIKDVKVVDALKEVELALTAQNNAAAIYLKSEAEITAGLVVLDMTYKIGNVKRYGAVGDGVTDDTVAFNPVLIAGGFDVCIPNGHYIVDSAISATDGILVGANTRIYCGPSVIVEVPYTETVPGIPDGGMQADRGFMRFKDIGNITIIGNHSVWRFANKPTVDQQRHMFSLRGANNVYMENLIAEKTGGDGWLVTWGTTTTLSTDVMLVNCWSDNCRRQGMSIVSAKNCYVLGGGARNIIGTSPESGMDIEPDSNADTMENIIVDGYKTEGCEGSGITVALKNFVGAVDKTVSITIRDCQDDESTLGYSVFQVDTNNGADKLTGHITFVDCLTQDNTNFGFRQDNYDALAARVKFIRPTIIRPNNAGSSSRSLGAAILIQASPGLASKPDLIGNLEIESPTIIDDRASPKITDYIFIKSFGDQHLGTHDGADNVAVLVDSTQDWTVDIFVDAKITNITDGSSALITANTSDTITGVLAGGTDDDWDIDDEYFITKVVRDVHIRGPLTFIGQDEPLESITFDGSGTFEDSTGVLVEDATSDYTFGTNNYTPKVTNAGAVGLVEVTLDLFPIDCPLVTFEVQAIQLLRITPDAGSGIFPGSNGAGKYVESNNVGDRITLRRKSGTEWYVVSEIGTWTREV